jgi:Carbohydrate binding module (family 6)/Calcineurin-like phosphoesterase/Purple acid Phosphatase, N-terminal domain
MVRPVRSILREGSLALVVLAVLAGAPLPARAQSSVLVAAGSTWRYLDDGSNQGTAWRSASFNDGSWAAGAAQLGYGDGDEATVVSYGGNTTSKHITTYFRRTFSVANPAAFASVNLRLLRDDGAVVYLNGVEVFRTNMPQGTISYATRAAVTAVGAEESTTYVAAAVSPSLLVAGTNVVAVEVHQADASSSDLSFDLELLGGSSVAITRGPYLQQGTPSSMIVRWQTSTPVIGRVQAGPAPGVVTAAAQESSPRTDHEVRVSGLTPESTYYYSVGTPAGPTAGDSTFVFRTAPPSGTASATRIWVIGDSGTADASARAVRDGYRAFSAGRPADLWLMLGDNAYQDGLDHEYQAAVFDMYPEMLRSTVLWPAYGNHEGYGNDAASNTGAYFSIFTLPKQAEAGGVPSGTEAYYAFDYGNVHFVCLESFETNRSTNGPMLNWLRQDLAANSLPWVIAYFHHPPYSKGSHDSDVDIEPIEMRQNVLPILETFGVDLVLAGHSHSYERSFLLDGHYGPSSSFGATMKKDGGSGRADGAGAYRKPTYGMAPHEGTVYLVAGNAGRVKGGALNHPAMYTSQSVLGSVVLDIDATRLDATFIDSTGARRDYFSIVKGATPPPPPPPPPPSGTSPFGGSPAPLPGLFQAENFDNGPGGAAYLDTTAGNTGGAYRSTDVDVEPSTDTGGGFNLSKTRAGEWLQYTVNVATSGTYTFEARVANIGTGAAFHVEIDGVDRTGSIAVPHTGGWQTWQTISKTGVQLSAGQHLLRVVLRTVSASNGAGNFNWFRLSSGSGPSTPAFGGTPAALPGVLQAENFDTAGPGVSYWDAGAGNSGGVYRTTNVDIGPTNDPGSGGYYVGWTRVGEWLQYTVEVTQTRTYTMTVRVANVGSGATFRVEVDGVAVTGPIAVPDTGDWDAWRTLSAGAVSLTQGPHVVRLVMLTRNAENAGVGNFGFVQFQ